MLAEGKNLAGEVVGANTAAFSRPCPAELSDLFGQVPEMPRELQVLKVGNIGPAGSTSEATLVARPRKKRPAASSACTH